MKIAYFDKNGMLYAVSPADKNLSLYDNRETAYRMDVLVLDGIIYDLSDTDQIQNIPIPAFRITANILELSYIFKIRCGMVETSDVLRAFVPKTIELMQASSFIWRRQDYLQVIRNFYRLGMFSEGDIFEANFRKENKDFFARVEDHEHELEHLRTKQYFENQVRKAEEYRQLQKICGDLLPKTQQGYYQIRTRKTKRFLQIFKIAQENGIELDIDRNTHYCKKYDAAVLRISEHTTENTPETYTCSICNKVGCDGFDYYGLPCVYRANTFPKIP